ncbi:hypothetical protein CC2G_003544 [Coprinopsis cinerea AmutBmut pab1-1]|nr:hypothetical protein CC2G_003544 [Coprinopsis cinerea AmutBmut pab1-1]
MESFTTLENGSWTTRGTSHRQVKKELKSSLTLTTRATGTRAAWVGWIYNPGYYDAEPIYGSWALNGGPSQRFEVPRIDPRANASVVYTPAAPMFMTPRLANRGPHKLVVRHESPRSSFTFDYLVVEEGDILYPPGDSYLASQDARKPVAAIVGGTIGGVLFVILCSVILYVYRRKKRLRGPKSNMTTAAISPLPTSTMTSSRKAANLPTETKQEPEPVGIQHSSHRDSGLPGLGNVSSQARPNLSYPLATLDGCDIPHYQVASTDAEYH